MRLYLYDKKFFNVAHKSLLVIRKKSLSYTLDPIMRNFFALSDNLSDNLIVAIWKIDNYIFAKHGNFETSGHLAVHSSALHIIQGILCLCLS